MTAGAMAIFFTPSAKVSPSQMDGMLITRVMRLMQRNYLKTDLTTLTTCHRRRNYCEIKR